MGKLWNSRKGRSSHWIHKKRRLLIYERDDYKCVYCLKKFPLHKLSLDHLLPRSLGGGHESNNLATCCLGCNSWRKDHPWEVWATPKAKRYIVKIINGEISHE